MVEIECRRYSRSQAQRPVGVRSGGEVGVGKDEGCDRSPEGVVCCADSRKAASMAGQVICFVSDLGRGGGCWAAVPAVGCRGEWGDVEVEEGV